MQRCRLLLGCCLFLIPVGPLARETLILRDGGRRATEAFLFEKGQFSAPDATATLPATMVSDWWLGGESQKSTAAPSSSGVVPDSAALETLTRWRDEALALAEHYPGCRGVQVLDAGFFRLAADHRHVYRYHFAGLVLNEELQEWGNLSLGFTEGRSRVKVLFARCLTPDGHILTLDPRAIAIVRPGSGTEFFDPNARQLNANLPGVQVGTLVEYMFEYETFAPEDWRLFFASFYFQGDVPVCRSTLEVSVPVDITLFSWEENWHQAGESGLAAFFSRLWPGHPYQRRTETVAGAKYQSRTWEKRNIGPLVTEPDMPPWTEVAPAVYTTILTDWTHVNRLIGDLQRERIVVTPEIQSTADTVTREARAQTDKVAALYHWVQKNIRYISIKSSLSSGWSGHPAAATLHNGYGDCTDKSILFCALLRAIGVEAEPVVLRTNDEGFFVPRYPMVFGNHCITEAHLATGDLFLDATTQDHRFPALRADDHGVLALNFMRGTRRVIPVPPGMEAHGKASVESMEISAAATLRVSSSCRYAGDYEAALRGGWKQVPEPLRSPIMQQYLNGIAPGAQLESFRMPDPQDLAVPFTLDFSYHIPGFVSATGALRILQLPERERHFPEVALEHRRYPIVYRTSEAFERRLTLRIPSGWRLVQNPSDAAVQNPHVSYRENYRLAGQALELTISFARCSQRIPVGDYGAYRKALREIEELTKKPLFFEVIPAATAGAKPSEQR